MVTENKNKNKIELKVNSMCERIVERVHVARNNVQRSIDIEMVKIYWLIGKEIVEEELKGKNRAGYGGKLIQGLSNRLTKLIGKGFGLTNLKYMRQFYLKYKHINIGHTVCDQFAITMVFQLSWSHYRLLMQIERVETREFYEKEAIANKWSVRELERQIASLLFERLAKSKDKKGVLRLAKKGQEIQTPEDAIKDPFILEFLNLPESPQLTESKLEEELINNLQHFLLELGKGFAFIGRQQRLTLEGDHFYADLVMYHIILKCYVIIDLKTNKLTHADLGQMQLYVNYYDQNCRTTGDNPSIGLILCAKKNDAMVKYMLGDKNKQIFASKYQLYLPTENELTAEIKRELKDLKYKLEHIKQ